MISSLQKSFFAVFFLILLNSEGSSICWAAEEGALVPLQNSSQQEIPKEKAQPKNRPIRNFFWAVLLSEGASLGVAESSNLALQGIHALAMHYFPHISFPANRAISPLSVSTPLLISVIALPLAVADGYITKWSRARRERRLLKSMPELHGLMLDSINRSHSRLFLTSALRTGFVCFATVKALQVVTVLDLPPLLHH